MSDESRLEALIDQERVERSRGDTRAFSDLQHHIAGVVDVLDALIVGLVKRGLVPPDFLITELEALSSIWQAPTPEHPEGRNLGRAYAIDDVLARLRYGQTQPADANKPLS